MEIKCCPISQTTDTIQFLDLGNVPIEGNLHKTREESLYCDKYPMVLQFFPESKLVSLTNVLDKNGSGERSL